MMADEDRQLVILISAAALVFGGLLALIVVGMMTRYRLEHPPRPETIILEEHLGSEVLSQMRLPFRPGPSGAVLLTPDPVTNSQYGWYVDGAGAPRPASFDDPGARGGTGPVLVARREEARAFCRWLEAETGLPVRLPRRGEVAPEAPGLEWVEGEPSPEGGAAAPQAAGAEEQPRRFRCALDR